MSLLSVMMLFTFVIFSAVFGQSQVSINNIALADGKGLVSIFADGQKKTIATDAKTIGEALEQNGIKLGTGDVVEPSAKTVINQPIYNVNVYRAYPAIIVDGNNTTTTLSGYRSPRQVVTSAGIKLYPEDRISVDRSEDFSSGAAIGQTMVIERATPVKLLIGGKMIEYRTWQKTVKGLLDEKGIEIKPSDQLDVDLSESVYKNMKIVLSRVTQDVLQITEAVEPEIQYKDDPEQPKAYQKVESSGKPGEKIVSYLINQKDGVELSRQVIDTKVTVQFEPKIVIRGSKPEPAGDNADLLSKLRQCEAGGSYQRNSGNGYYGAYQFSAATWNRWDTGYARADLAPASVQDETVLKNAKASKGGFWSQHPGCSSKLSLPKFPY